MFSYHGNGVLICIQYLAYKSFKLHNICPLKVNSKFTTEVDVRTNPNLCYVCRFYRFLFFFTFKWIFDWTSFDTRLMNPSPFFPEKCFYKGRNSEKSRLDFKREEVLLCGDMSHTFSSAFEFYFISFKSCQNQMCIQKSVRHLRWSFFAKVGENFVCLLYRITA